MKISSTHRPWARSRGGFPKTVLQDFRGDIGSGTPQLASRPVGQTIVVRRLSAAGRAKWHCASILLHSFLTLILAISLFAGETRTWSQGDFADFEKGVIKNLSVRSDGLLMLAPHSREFFDTSSAYLWALAQDSKGNLYTGGGT